MKVTKVHFNGKEYNLNIDSLKSSENQLLEAITFCNNTKVSNENTFIGSQTEIALMNLAKDAGFNINSKDERNLIHEIPFNSDRKKMSVLYKKDNLFRVYSKGAAEVLINDCKFIYLNNEKIALTEDLKAEALKQCKSFSSQALRVIGVAYKDLESKNTHSELETDLVWLGSVAMIDPPRKEVKDSIENCLKAGIRIIMITGDNTETAKAIAKSVSIESDFALTGSEIDSMNDETLITKIPILILISLLELPLFIKKEF